MWERTLQCGELLNLHDVILHHTDELRQCLRGWEGLWDYFIDLRGYLQRHRIWLGISGGNMMPFEVLTLCLYSVSDLNWFRTFDTPCHWFSDNVLSIQRIKDTVDWIIWFIAFQSVFRFHSQIDPLWIIWFWLYTQHRIGRIALVENRQSLILIPQGTRNIEIVRNTLSNITTIATMK